MCCWGCGLKCPVSPEGGGRKVWYEGAAHIASLVQGAGGRGHCAVVLVEGFFWSRMIAASAVELGSVLGGESAHWCSIPTGIPG